MQIQVFVRIKSSLEYHTENGIDYYDCSADAFRKKENGDEFWENINIFFLARPPKVFFEKIQPNLECRLILEHSSQNSYRCDGAAWYLSNGKFYNFKTDQEIPREYILGHKN